MGISKSDLTIYSVYFKRTFENIPKKKFEKNFKKEHVDKIEDIINYKLQKLNTKLPKDETNTILKYELCNTYELENNYNKLLIAKNFKNQKEYKIIKEKINERLEILENLINIDKTEQYRTLLEKQTYLKKTKETIKGKILEIEKKYIKPNKIKKTPNYNQNLNNIIYF